MANTEKNPLDQVYDTLWALIDASVPLRSLVKPANTIRFNSDKDANPIKDRILGSDLPEMTLLPAGISGMDTGNSSCYRRLVHDWSIVIATGDFRIQNMGDVQFALFAALHQWPETLTNLTWHMNKFVVQCWPTNAQHGFSDPKVNRDIRGWSAIWSCSVEMNFPLSLLTEFNQGI